MNAFGPPGSTPWSPGPSWYKQTPPLPTPASQGHQSVRYFTISFFAISLFISVIFTFSLAWHCWVAVRRRLLRGVPPSQDAARPQDGSQGVSGHLRRSIRVPEFLEKEGVIVVQPDGHTDVGCVVEIGPASSRDASTQVQLELVPTPVAGGREGASPRPPAAHAGPVAAANGYQDPGQLRNLQAPALLWALLPLARTEGRAGAAPQSEEQGGAGAGPDVEAGLGGSSSGRPRNSSNGGASGTKDNKGRGQQVWPPASSAGSQGRVQNPLAHSYAAGREAAKVTRNGFQTE